MTAEVGEAEIWQKMNQIRAMVMFAITSVYAVATLILIEMGHPFLGFGVYCLTLIILSGSFAVLGDGWNRALWRRIGVDGWGAKP